jgi:hypothetical protein
VQVRPLGLALGAPIPNRRTSDPVLDRLGWKELAPARVEGRAFLPSCDETPGDSSGSGERIDFAGAERCPLASYAMATGKLVTKWLR